MEEKARLEVRAAMTYLLRCSQPAHSLALILVVPKRPKTLFAVGSVMVLSRFSCNKNPRIKGMGLAGDLTRASKQRTLVLFDLFEGKQARPKYLGSQ